MISGIIYLVSKTIATVINKQLIREKYLPLCTGTLFYILINSNTLGCYSYTTETDIHDIYRGPYTLVFTIALPKYHVTMVTYRAEQ
jgi:hypothetical protein